MLQSPLPLSIVILTPGWNASLQKTLASLPAVAEIILASDQAWSLKDLPTSFRSLPIRQLVLNQPIVADFALARNQATTAATQGWVLHLDSDERLDEQAAQYLTTCLNQSQVTGWYCHRIDYWQQQPLHYGEVANIWLLRLAQRSALSFERPIHEVGQLKQGKAKHSKLVLHHYAHESVSEFLSTVESYARREALYRVTLSNHPPAITSFLIWPVGKWLVNVLVKQAWRDGMPGLIYATLMSLHSLWVRTFYYEERTS